MEEARAHAAEILKIKPDYTVEFYRKTTPYKDQKYLDSLVELLIKAGLPEKSTFPYLLLIGNESALSNLKIFHTYPQNFQHVKT